MNAFARIRPEDLIWWLWRTRQLRRWCRRMNPSTANQTPCLKVLISLLLLHYWTNAPQHSSLISPQVSSSLGSTTCSTQRSTDSSMGPGWRFLHIPTRWKLLPTLSWPQVWLSWSQVWRWTGNLDESLWLSSWILFVPTAGKGWHHDQEAHRVDAGVLFSIGTSVRGISWGWWGRRWWGLHSSTLLIYTVVNMCCLLQGLFCHPSFLRIQTSPHSCSSSTQKHLQKSPEPSSPPVSTWTFTDFSFLIQSEVLSYSPCH